ncbi:MAG TPA: glycosyltransferase family 1 protein [Gemmatimonadales bacterium]|nr:glycosyltransferase family 1 protein [Gemmatimonadales bacterium]
MRIALVSDTYAPQVNGVTTVVARIAQALRDFGHDVAVVAPRYPGNSTSSPGELRIPSAAFPPYPAIRLSLPRFGAVARFLDTFKPDVVHVATEGPLGLTGRRYAVRRHVPLVTSYHTNFPQYAQHYGAGVVEPLVWKWLRWFHRPAALTQTPGEAVRDELERRGIGRPVVWGRGVDTTHFNPAKRSIGWRRWLAGGDDTAIVLHVGRLAPEKNIDVLAEAWIAARERVGQRATFVLAGEGPETRRLLTLLPWVRQLGFLDRGRLAEVYASADICVLPSRTETCGLVALEAMASGLAVVAADAGGFRESIVHGRSGVLVAPDDATGFAAEILSMVIAPQRRGEIANAARAAAIARDVAPENLELLKQYAAVAGLSLPGTASCAA